MQQVLPRVQDTASWRLWQLKCWSLAVIVTLAQCSGTITEDGQNIPCHLTQMQKYVTERQGK